MHKDMTIDISMQGNSCKCLASVLKNFGKCWLTQCMVSTNFSLAANAGMHDRCIGGVWATGCLIDFILIEEPHRGIMQPFSRFWKPLATTIEASQMIPNAAIDRRYSVRLCFGCHMPIFYFVLSKSWGIATMIIGVNITNMRVLWAPYQSSIDLPLLWVSPIMDTSKTSYDIEKAHNREGYGENGRSLVGSCRHGNARWAYGVCAKIHCFYYKSPPAACMASI